jgi:hypothetical protein
MKQGLIIDAYGDKAWYLNGELHRVVGPAFERVNGNKEWYLNGELHREDGPAREYTDGSKFWYLNGERHRVDGPACEFANGTKKWCLNNKLVYSKNVNNIHLFKLSKEFKKSIIKHKLST